MRMLTRCLKDASSPPPKGDSKPEGRGILDCVLKTWSQWQHLWVKGPQLMTMYWNLKTLLGCYHANDGHNWRLLPEVKWERECCPWEKSWQWKLEWKGTESCRRLCQLCYIQQYQKWTNRASALLKTESKLENFKSVHIQIPIEKDFVWRLERGVLFILTVSIRCFGWMAVNGTLPN